jgi:ribosomal protein L12E/L44/L45/RPP1/RPP2
MHHATRKKLVAEYSELITSNIEEAKSQMAANGLTEEEIEEVITEASKPSGETPAKTITKASKPSGEEEVENGNLSFEKWQMTKKRDDEGNVVGLDKVKKLKNVSIRQEQADLLNDQAVNTFIQYFPV